MTNVSLGLTVVIPTLMRSKYLSRIIDVLRASEGDSVEVLIVADTGHGARLSEANALGCEPGRRFRLISSVRGGPSAARNVGIQHATNELIAFLDDDCVPTPEWCLTAQQFMTQHPECTAAGGLIEQAAFQSLAVDYLRFTRHLQKIYDRSPPPGIISANCVFRRQALVSVGGFDESFDRPGGEDVDISFRLRQKGAVLSFAPQLKVTHFTAPSILGLLRIMFAYGRGTARISQLHNIQRQMLGLCSKSLIGLLSHSLRHCATIRIAFRCTDTSEGRLKNCRQRVLVMSVGSDHGILPRARYELREPRLRHVALFPIVEMLREIAFQLGGVSCR